MSSITYELEGFKSIGLNWTSALDLSVDVKMLGKARSRLEEQLHKLDDRKISALQVLDDDDDVVHLL